MNYTKLSIPLSEQEQRALKMAASKACRRPRDHVRFIVLSALGVIEPSAEMSKPAIAESFATRSNNGFVVGNPS